jgi:hypothetical protein
MSGEKGRGAQLQGRHSKGMERVTVHSGIVLGTGTKHMAGGKVLQPLLSVVWHVCPLHIPPVAASPVTAWPYQVMTSCRIPYLTSTGWLPRNSASLVLISRQEPLRQSVTSPSHLSRNSACSLTQSPLPHSLAPCSSSTVQLPQNPALLAPPLCVASLLPRPVPQGLAHLNWWNAKLPSHTQIKKVSAFVHTHSPPPTAGAGGPPPTSPDVSCTLRSRWGAWLGPPEPRSHWPGCDPQHDPPGMPGATCRG